MLTAPSNQIDSFTAPLGFLDAASIATRASLSIVRLLHNQRTDTEPFVAMADLLPRMLSAQSFGEVRRECVDTPRLIAVDYAIEKLQIPAENTATVDGIVTVLEEIDLDLRKLASGELLPRERLSQLRLFCLGLSDSLIDQVPLPSLPADARRV